MHHGKTHLGILLDEELRDPHVQSALHMRRCGASGDDMQLRALFGDDDVMHTLVEIGGPQIKAALHREDGLHALLGTDEIACGRRLCHIGRVLVSVRRHQLPPVVLQIVILLQGGSHIHDLHALKERLGHDRRLIHLHISSRGI